MNNVYRPSAGWLIIAILAGCSPQPGSALMNDGEYQKHVDQYQQQLDKTGEQLEMLDEQLETSEEQNKRFNTLLDRWEKQADRYDKLLEKWEGQPVPPDSKPDSVPAADLETD